MSSSLISKCYSEEIRVGAGVEGVVGCWSEGGRGEQRSFSHSSEMVHLGHDKT